MSLPAREAHLLVCTVLGVETQASVDRHGERTGFGYAEISRRAWSVVWAISGGTHRTGHRSTKGAPVDTGRAVCRSTIDTSFSVCSQQAQLLIHRGKAAILANCQWPYNLESRAENSPPVAL